MRRSSRYGKASPLGICSCLVTLLVAVSSARALDTPPDVRTVIVPQAQVWCGPSTSDGLYPTNLLRQGDRVQVEHELESGWLEIRPPAGSFSWINNRFVTRIKNSMYVVSLEDSPVPVFIGSSLKTDRPNKYGMKLSRGTQIRVVGQSITDEEGKWLPIEPPEGEVRYLRKEAVTGKAGGTAAATLVASTSSVKPSAPPPDGDTLWRDADRAERAGRIAEAIRLYRLAGAANLSANTSRADEAYRRAHWLEEAQGNHAPGGSYYYPDRDGRTANGSPYTLPTYQGGNHAFQTIGSAAPGTTSGQLVAMQGAASGGTQPGEYHYRGKLELAHSTRFDAERRYRLYDNSGKNLITWVVAGPGVDLSSYDGRAIELWGIMSYKNDLRHWLLTATHVKEQP